MQLRGMLEAQEALLEWPDLPKKQKALTEKLGLALAIAVEQIEWVLGIRTGTAVDDYSWNEFSAN